MQALFSIIIPVYNVEKYLRDCLDSVLSQTYQGSYEVICVNDGSTDESLDILEEYKGKIKNLFIISQVNKGLSEARNAGLRVAKGDYVFFLDSDDWIEPNALNVLAENIDGEDFIGFNGRRYFDDGTQEEPDKGIIENNISGWEYHDKHALINRKFHFVCAVIRIYRREFLLDNNLFFEPGIYHEDEFFTPVAYYYAKRVSSLLDSLYMYRIREGSITQKPSKKHVSDMIVVANKLSDFFISKNDIDKLVLYRTIAGKYFSAFMPPKSDILENDFSDVKRMINWDSFKTVSIYPRHKRIYRLIKFNPFLFQLYLKIENLTKKHTRESL
jgi:glycosyltransferase involved in cell wall biosynthesis